MRPAPLPIVPLKPRAPLQRASLAATGLACRRGRRLLFRGVDVRLVPASVTWLRGTNGSGKSSLLRLLAGLAAPTEGDITLDGTPLSKAGAAARSSLLYIGHANALKDDLTLAEAITFHAELAGLDDAAGRAAAAIGRLGIGALAGAPVRTLSQGERRRGALARLALDDTPRIWLLDEPFDALDAASIGLLAALIDANRQRGGAVLLTSHQPVPLPGAVVDVDLERWRVQ